ncbi:hypothetical protein IFM89_031702 [Coptis chinensis]|uniref:FAR1 domain-containing protein n=1 Tax=Coptis chinensis TaxID=261450 RepID=A0A835LS43_9MAGN|nr:hypothetical protein IFM89_031702 [Coptis chinensis]
MEGSEKIEEVVNENLNERKVGMKFDSFDDMLQYYRKYGNEKGFPVKIRTSRKGDDGDMRWVILACCREGKSRSTGKNLFKNNQSVQNELKGLLYCGLSRTGGNSNIEKYEVQEVLVGLKQQDITFMKVKRRRTKMAMGWIEHFINEFKNGARINETTQCTPSTVDQPSGSGTIFDLLVARRKGRPTIKRKQGKTEIFIQKAKQKKKKEKEGASNIPHDTQGKTKKLVQKNKRNKEIELEGASDIPYETLGICTNFNASKVRRSHIPHGSEDISSQLNVTDGLSFQFDASQVISTQLNIPKYNLPMEDVNQKYAEGYIANVSHVPCFQDSHSDQLHRTNNYPPMQAYDDDTFWKTFLDEMDNGKNGGPNNSEK